MKTSSKLALTPENRKPRVDEAGYDASRPIWKQLSLALVVVMFMAGVALKAELIDFNTNMPSGLNFSAIPSTYQPIPDLTIGYGGVGLFNGGPDHTTGVTGATNYSTYQTSGSPQVFTFSKPVSIPSVWLTSYAGTGDTMVIYVFADTAGSAYLGTAYFDTAVHPNGGSYVWTECTNLDDVAFNGMIRRVEFSATDNAQIDDMTVNVNTNTGAFLGLSATIPTMDLYVGMSREMTVIADYEFVTGLDVSKGAGVSYASSDTNVVTVTTNGLVQTVGMGIAEVAASLQGQTSTVFVAVSPVVGELVDFTSGLTNIGNFVALPSDYQPIPGLTMGYSNVGLFSGGPDNTTGVLGGHSYCTYQFNYNSPSAITFSKPVSLPSLWLTTFGGTGDAININVYGDTAGSNLLGTVQFPTVLHSGAGNYAWARCTDLDDVTYNGLIRRIELSAGAPNANLDDMAVVVSTNTGALLDISMTLAATNLLQGMSRQATVIANYEFVSGSVVTKNSGVAYSSSATGVVTVDTNGLVQAIGSGTATVMASLDGKTSMVSVAVSPLSGVLVDFNGMGNVGNRVAIPSNYQPVPSLIMSYTNVALFSNGPDHTAATPGSNHYNCYQADYTLPQVITFNRPVSLPSMWLASFSGTGEAITISAYSDTAGANLLGTVLVPTELSPGEGGYVWSQCTDLDDATYNGQIRRIELNAGAPNAQLDDLEVVLGELATFSATMSGTDMVLSWSAAGSAGATLIYSPVLGDGAVWTPVLDAPSLVGPNYQLVVPATESAAFYRLQY